jgi:hypothetical protein
MGYGNITRALTLANRQLAAAGVRNPTPQQLAAALTGGTVTTGQGATAMRGVLQLRSEGMGWGQIAHAIGARPGKSTGMQPLATSAPSSSGVTSAAGPANVAGTPPKATAAAAHRGIVTASGASPATVHRPAHARSAAVVSATGASSAHGLATAGSHGSGQARGHAGRQ